MTRAALNFWAQCWLDLIANPRLRYRADMVRLGLVERHGPLQLTAEGKRMWRAMRRTNAAKPERGE